MNITTTTVDGVTLVRLDGDLDTTSSPLAQDAINQIIDDGAKQLLVNLENVSFVSSTGLRVLLSTAKRLGSEAGSLKISNLNETVNEVFEISGFITILNVFPTEEDALQGS
jgi:anti-sigma B factor antagonist